MPNNPDVLFHAPFKFPLKHLAERYRQRKPVKIVAIGSSSVAGEWQTDIVPFPPRLEMSLRWDLQDTTINVINRGARGEDAPKQKKRLQRDVIDEHPAMVIWQVGTNAVWKRQDLGDVRDAISDGLDLLRRQPMDIVLMDLQYVPAILTVDKVEKANWMVSTIARLARGAGANVFCRFDLMRHWHLDEGIKFDDMLNLKDPDKLHQNDASTLRLSNALRDLIVEAARR